MLLFLVVVVVVVIRENVAVFVGGGTHRVSWWHFDEGGKIHNASWWKKTCLLSVCPAV